MRKNLRGVFRGQMGQHQGNRLRPFLLQGSGQLPGVHLGQRGQRAGRLSRGGTGATLRSSRAAGRGGRRLERGLGSARLGIFPGRAAT